MPVTMKAEVCPKKIVKGHRLAILVVDFPKKVIARKDHQPSRLPQPFLLQGSSKPSDLVIVPITRLFQNVTARDQANCTSRG